MVVSMEEFVKFDALSADECPPEIGEFLHDRGLPRKVITIFTAAPDAGKRSVLINDREVTGVVLGYSREQDDIFLDFESGKVWLLASWGANRPIPVNENLHAFAKSLALVGSRYPFYPAGRDLDDAEQAEESLRVALEEIDELSTVDPDGFWSAFLDDVGNGDYAES
jgi:hypothetical protein